MHQRTVKRQGAGRDGRSYIQNIIRLLAGASGKSDSSDKEDYPMNTLGIRILLFFIGTASSVMCFPYVDVTVFFR